MKLAIFDVDGTLTDTNSVDNACFVRAFDEALGIKAEDVDWDTCPHVTDAAIFEFLFEKCFARRPNNFETDEFKAKFIGLLEESRTKNADGFREIPGAGAAFQKMQHERDWVVVIATGCWSDSAELKLRAANIKHEGVPAATADDYATRERIVGESIWKACRHYGHSTFDKIVSIGDGAWDARTARNMRLSFIGVGDANGKLKDTGARHILPDLSDFDTLMSYLDESKVPGQ